VRGGTQVCPWLADKEHALEYPVTETPEIQSVPAVIAAATPPAPTAPATPSFESFGLAEPLLKGLAASGFVRPTEIQARALPMALLGRDLMASAQTGTGKTAAFALPALQRLLKPSAVQGRGPRVLVLTPTRELAGQVEGVVQELAKFAKLRIGSIVGGVPFPPQERLLRGTVDLLVATPGRLIDHMEKRLVDFSRLELFVLDEADRMLDMGFIKPVKQIAAALPKERQTMLFSATLEGGILAIAKQLLRDPVTVQFTTATQKHASISQRVFQANGPDHKQAILAHLLADPELTQAIVFCATKRGAGRMAKRLVALGHKAAALHGNMRQSARNRTVDQLRSGKVKLLVATDVAGRGVDFEGLSHVINFDLPQVAEDYIHRVGRTGRNGASGIAVSLVGPDDRSKLANIERLIGRRLEHHNVAGLAPTAFPKEPQRGSLVSAAPARTSHVQRRQFGQGQGSGRSGQGQGPARSSQGPARNGQGQSAGRNGQDHGSRPHGQSLSARPPSHGPSSRQPSQEHGAQPDDNRGNRRDSHAHQGAEPNGNVAGAPAPRRFSGGAAPSSAPRRSNPRRASGRPGGQGFW
jgi:superfamily II DNA/RNA helicase